MRQESGSFPEAATNSQDVESEFESETAEEREPPPKSR